MTLVAKEEKQVNSLVQECNKKKEEQGIHSNDSVYNAHTTSV